MRARTVLRLGAEVAFISLVAVIAHMADLSTAGIIVIMAVAWLLTAIAEGLIAHGRHGAATFVPPVRPFSGGFQHRESAPAVGSSAAPPEEIAPAWLESAEVLGVHVAGFEPAVEAGKADPVDSEEAGLLTEVTQASEHSGEVEAPPEETGVELRPNPWPRAEERWPRRRSPGELAELSVEQRPEPDPPPEAEPESAAAAPSSPAHGWNVWELERLARRLGEAGAARNEEWAFLLVYLREFADQDGALPADLDALVRESFPELVAVAESR